MRRHGRVWAVSLLLCTAGAVVAFVWPKYGLCFSTSRADEIACEIRRNLHLGPHFNWAVNRHTVRSVALVVDKKDIPPLLEVLGHERPAVRNAAGSVLLELGNDGVRALHAARRSDDFDVSHAAQDALWTWEIRQDKVRYELQR